MSDVPAVPASTPLSPPGTPPVSPSAWLASWWRETWPLLGVLLGFALAAAIVPTLTPVATTDDWAYSRMAQILVQEGRLSIFPVVAATSVLPVVWNALFGLVFEPTLGIFRLATVVITALGGVVLYALCRDLGVTRGRTALGVAAHLANPLTFVLAFTVMTDAHFVTVLLAATWLFARALQPGGAVPVAGAWLAAGSLVAGLAFLSRQQGALIVPGVLLFLVVTRRLRFDWASARLLLLLVGPVALVMAGYYAWLQTSGIPPSVQSAFLREAVEEGWSGTWWLLRRLTFVELLYLGFFTLPIMATVLPGVPTLPRGMSRPGWVLAAAWSGVALVGVVLFWQRGARMPYIAQFFGSGGLGPPDVLGSRPRLLGPDVRGMLTIACLVATLLLAMIAGRAVSQALAARSVQPGSRGNSVAGLMLCIGLGQVAGVLPPSYHYIGWAAGSLDRYLLPLAPFAIALALWGVREVAILPPLGWLVVAGMLTFSVAGTRDYLVYLHAVWQMADVAVARGAPLDRLDAGAGWDGYHLYETGLSQRVKSRTPRGGPWWVYFYGPATDSAYIVSSRPQDGYRVVARREYATWLPSQPTRLFLLRRVNAPWPPAPDPESAYPRRRDDGRPVRPAATPGPAASPAAQAATS